MTATPSSRDRRARPAAQLVLVLALTSCSDNPADPQPGPQSQVSTWRTIEQEILGPNCTSCHRDGTAFAAQSGLVLTDDVAYENLVDVPPTNAIARADGLMRVNAAGLTGVQRSFLWEKINWPNEEHFLTEHPDYGNLMPLGGPPLTYGELEYIRAWIAAGAPRTGDVVDRDVLRDQRRYEPGPFVGLEPPPAGSGLHFELGPFAVQPFSERELFYYEPLDTTEDLYVSRYEIAMRQGSHHFIAHTFNDIPVTLMPADRQIRDLHDGQGNLNGSTLYAMLYHDFFVGTQTPRSDYEFPPGVALLLPAGTGLDLNSHYVNRGDEPIVGEVHLNLHTMAPEAVQHVARVLRLNNTQLSLPPRQVTTVERTYTMEERRHVFLLVSHAHEHMLEFEVEVVGGSRDGERVYYANDWQHPPILHLDPPLTLETGDGLKLIATYDNWTDESLAFGFLSEDEMMILFGYYYADPVNSP